MLSITSDVKCDVCGSFLTIESEEMEGSEILLSVSPCEECIKELKEESEHDFELTLLSILDVPSEARTCMVCLEERECVLTDQVHSAICYPCLVRNAREIWVGEVE